MRAKDLNRTAKIAIMIAFALILSQAALAIGIAPSTTILDYKPGQKITYSVDVVNNGNEELEIMLYAKGEFSDRVKILTPVFRMGAAEQTRRVEIEFATPERIPLAGPHSIDIVAVGSTPTLPGHKAVVKADVAVISKLIIDVPYPAKYAEGRIYVLDTESGRPITIDMPVFNKGSEDIDAAYAQIAIYASDGTKIDEMTTEKRPIKKGEDTKFTTTASKTYPIGDYKAKAIIYYDGRGIEAETLFSIGQLEIEIKSLVVDSFTLGGVAKFDILLYNAWNSELRNVYAQMQIYGKDNKMYTDFKTVATDIEARGLGRLEGYWYTQGVEPGIYNARITLYYANRMAQKEFELEVQPNKIIARSLATGEAISAEDAVNLQKNGILILIIAAMAAVIGVLAFKLRKKGGMPPAARPPAELPPILPQQAQTINNTQTDDNQAGPDKGQENG